MKLLKIGLVGLGLAGAAGIFAVLGYLLYTDSRLRADLAAARVQLHDLDALRADHGRLAAAAPARAAAAHRDQEELARRRIEVDSLRVQLAKLQRTNVPRDDGRPGELERLKARAAAMPVPPGMIAPESFQNRGFATPADAWQTTMWAWASGNSDANAGALAFLPESHAALQAIFDGLSEEERAAFGTPEQMGAKVLAIDHAITPVALRVGFPRFQLVSATPSGPGEVELATRIQTPDGKFFEPTPFRLRQFPDGWKRVVSAEGPAQIAAIMNAMPATQRLMFAKK